MVPMHTRNVIRMNFPVVNTAHAGWDGTENIIRPSISSKMKSMGVKISVRLRRVNEINFVCFSSLQMHYGCHLISTLHSLMQTVLAVCEDCARYFFVDKVRRPVHLCR